jgi:hypothetical protein
MAEKIKTVDDYIAGLPPDQQAIVTKLRSLIKSASDINEDVLTDFVKQAVRLNQELGDPTRSPKSS